MHERSLGSLASGSETLNPQKEHPVDVVDVRMLPAAMVERVFGYGISDLLKMKADVANQTEAMTTKTFHASFI
jgi:hypothetical protein